MESFNKHAVATMSSDLEAAVVVDPYSSGRYMLYELKARGVKIICVRSSLKMGEFFLKAYTTHASYFVETLDFENFGSVEQLAHAIRKLPFRISGVIAGSEPGVELADRLAEHMNMPTANGTELLQARKDKAEMQERLRQCGVPAAEQFRSADVNELRTWASERNQWPVVAKPISSCGSDGVFFCHTEADLINAHAEIMGKVNPSGATNDEIALQEFLEGDEYMIDTVSYGGKHICCQMRRYFPKRRGLPWNKHAIVPVGDHLVPPSGDVEDSMVSYVFNVLDAVGLKYGPCHTEVIVTKRGPILVEVNARMHGCQGPHLCELSTGTSLATYSADTLIAGGKLFNSLYESTSRWLYPVNRQSVMLDLVSPLQGTLSISIKEAVEALGLASVMEVNAGVQVGEWIQQTCDLTSSPGSVLLVHESWEQIEADIAAIRSAEESGKLFAIKDATEQEFSPSLSGFQVKIAR